MSADSIPPRSTAAFDACTARSTGEIPFSFPPNVPNGVRTAERKTMSAGTLAAAHAELPRRIELGTAAGAVFCREVLSAVRAIGDGSALGKSAAAVLAAFRDLHARKRGHRERSRPFVCRGVAIAISSRWRTSPDRVAAGVLGRDRDSEIFHGFRNE